MSSRIEQNRLVIEIACECLKQNGFMHVNRNRDQGTFPDVYVTADRNGILYLIGITGREETGADGEPNPSFNLVRTEGDRRKAKTLAQNTSRVLAFVAVALRREDGKYSTYFEELDRIGFPRSIPMLPQERSNYQSLAIGTYDARVRALLLS
jgi:hypothetical protein